MSPTPDGSCRQSPAPLYSKVRPSALGAEKPHSAETNPLFRGLEFLPPEHTKLVSAPLFFSRFSIIIQFAVKKYPLVVMLSIVPSAASGGLVTSDSFEVDLRNEVILIADGGNASISRIGNVVNGRFAQG